ncbi:helix-turn-helix domain-containing protein [Actinomycetospora endophytica]|uniref:Helix-turn-helix domain-containing protein n=1 Tax=Actinomycetospora endophytica TaxID=2291215 RepID=A0ABS8PFW8_9PSEU|nr:helix-turn-helix domain-containing protein [Actinomycetospora endophytica]MCD2196301.1 helix-turn-helix domain-containing protein [Actinomycetospora endophytica]
MSDDAMSSAVVRGGFATADPRKAEEFLSTTYVDQRLQLTGPREGFTAAVSSLCTPDLAVSRLETSAGLIHTVDEVPADVLIVSAPTRGHIGYFDNAYHDVQTVVADAVLSPPLGRVHVESDNLDITIVTLDRGRVADYAASLTGLDPRTLAFDGLAPLTPAMARYWTDAVAHVREDVLADPWAGEQPILLDQAFRTLAAALVSTFANNALARTTDPQAPPVRGDVSAATVRELADYLDTHADRAIGPADIAAVGDAPYRELAEGVRRRYGRHPAELLWRARLHGVHRDLLDADPHAGVIVTHVAARWGFGRPARFRIAYARAFDESPEDTLLR